MEKNEFKLICNRKSDYLTKKRTKMIKTEKKEILLQSKCSMLSVIAGVCSASQPNVDIFAL